jgi:hypothetical protein
LRDVVETCGRILNRVAQKVGDVRPGHRQIAAFIMGRSVIVSDKVVQDFGDGRRQGVGIVT